MIDAICAKEQQMNVICTCNSIMNSGTPNSSKAGMISTGRVIKKVKANNEMRLVWIQMFKPGMIVIEQSSHLMRGNPPTALRQVLHSL